MTETKTLDTNRFRTSDINPIGSESIWYEVPNTNLGTESASITGGTTEFSAVAGDSSTGGPPFIDLTITLAQSGGTYGLCKVTASGADTGSFQIVEIGGRSIGPIDLDDHSVLNWLAIAWQGANTTFKINVKPGIAIRTHNASIAIVDHNGSQLLSADLSAAVQDQFMNYALSTTSANLTDAWIPVSNTGNISDSDNTMTSIFGSYSGSFATATDATTGTGTPEFVSSGLSYFSISRGVSNGSTADHTSDRTLATPITSSFSGANMSGSWFLIYQGESVSAATGNQADMFYFGTNNNARLRNDGPSGGNNKFYYLSDDTTTSTITTAPATTVTFAITRNGAGNLSFRSQPADGGLNGPETASSTNNDDPFGLSSAKFEVTTSNSGENLRYILVCVLIFDDELSAAEILGLNQLVE